MSEAMTYRCFRHSLLAGTGPGDAGGEFSRPAAPPSRALATLWALAAALAALAPAPLAAGTLGPFADFAAAEAFLKEAEVVSMEPLGEGVTQSSKAVLSNGATTAAAVWKTIDEFRPVMRFDDGGPPELGFRDTYKSEIAAYELDRLLELGRVPPTVPRTIRKRQGSLQLWLTGCISEAERRRAGKKPTDALRWFREVARSRAFLQLVGDADHQNQSNLLVDPEFRIYVIDSSRAFRTHKDVLDSDSLTRFSRQQLDALRALDESTLETRLGQWLSKGQRASLLKRRDRILERAAELVAERGPEAVLLP